jgi:single-strand DNA-binding protein
MINKVILIGNVGKDPEVKVISDSLKIAKFSVATSESYTDKKGEKITTTQWHNCVVWNKQADIVEKYVTKGMQLYIEGKLNYSKSEKDGETKYFTEIIVNEFRFVGKKESLSSENSNNGSIAPTTTEPPFDDNFPF